MPQVVAFVKAVGAAWAAFAAKHAVLAFVIKTAAVMAVSTAVSRMLYKGPSVNGLMTAAKNRGLMSRQSDFPRRIIYGRVKVSGPIVFMHETGNKRQYIQLIVPVASHKCAGFDKVWIGEEEVTLNSGGDIIAGPYSGLGRIIFHDGDANQNYDTSLAAVAPTLWTSAHRGRGVAYFYIQLEWKDEVWTSGLPNFSALVRGKLVYDPRDGLTKYSTNAALCLLDYLMNAGYGPGIPLADFHSATLTATINNCDEDVSLAAGGTEKRYTINGDVLLDQDRRQVIQAMLTSMGGSNEFHGGKYWLRSAMWNAPTRPALTVDDLRAPIEVTPRISRRDLVNGGKGLYISEAEDFQTTDFVPYAPAIYQAEDNGVRMWRDFTYPFTLSPSTARRLTKIAIERTRQQITVVFPGKLQTMNCHVGAVVPITHADFGWTNKYFEVVGFKLSLYEQASGGGDGSLIGCDITLRETASACYDWNNGEDVTSDLSPNTDLPDPSNVEEPTGLTLASGTPHGFVQEDGTFVARLHVSWTAPDDIYVTSGGRIRIEYAIAGSGAWLEWQVVDGETVENYITGLAVGVSFDVRIRAENHYGTPSDWVEALAHTLLGDTTAPATPTGLTATAMAGYIELRCNPSAALDAWEYEFYRSTTNTFGTASLIGENGSPWFDDSVGLTAGTAYYYWVVVSDRSENDSAPSTSASAVAQAALDNNVPTAPTAATFVSTATYDTGDGTVFAQVTISVPATPGDATGTEVLYRKVGSSEWQIATQLKNSGTVSFTIDDLASGVAYDVATRTWKITQKSAAVTATASPYTTATKTGKPSTPATATITAVVASDGVPASYSGGLVTYASWVSAPTMEADCASWEMFIGSFGIMPANGSAIVPANVVPAAQKRAWVYTNPSFVLQNGVALRKHNRSGVIGDWSTWRLISPDLSNSYAGDMGAQNSDDVEVSAIRTGSAGAASVKEILCRYEDSIAPSLTIGATFHDIDISNRGFTSRPDSGTAVVTFPHNEVEACYYPNDVNNTSTNARIHFTPAIPSTGSREIAINLLETF